MTTAEALDACYTQQKSTSDGDSAEQGLVMTQQLLIAAPASLQGHAVVGLPGATGFRRDGQRMQCQVADCEVDLRTTKPYCIKKRLCPEHLTAQAVRRRGTAGGFWRFCQQCGKLEPLESFDGAKRSCRARLQKRRAHNWQSYKRTRQIAYKDKMLTRIRDLSSPMAEGGDIDTDNEDDEYQHAMNDEDHMAMTGGDYGAYDNYAADGDAANAAAGLSALAAELQQQQLYQTLLCSAAAVAAAAAPVPEHSLHYTQPINGQMYGAVNTVDAVAAAAAAIGGGWQQHDAHGSSNAQNPQPHNAKHWPSDQHDADLHKQQQQQVAGDTASTAAVAATLAAMAAGARQGSLGHSGGKPDQLPDHQAPQLDTLAGAAAAAAAAATPVGDYLKPMASRTLSEQLSDRAGGIGTPHKQQQQQEVRHHGVGDKHQATALYHYHHQQQQQQQDDTYQYVAGQPMELDAAAAAAMPVPIRPNATSDATVVHKQRKSATAAPPAAAANQRPAADVAAAGSQAELQHLLEKLMGSMGPQTDAAATLAAMRSLSEAAAAAAAAAAAHQDSPKERQQQQQQRPAGRPSLTPSGSTTLADEDAAAATHFRQQHQQQQASPEVAHKPGNQAAAAAATDVAAQLAALFNMSGKQTKLAQQNHLEPKSHPAAAAVAAAPKASWQQPEDAIASLTAGLLGGNAGHTAAAAGGGGGGGMGLLLSAVVNGLLGDQRQQAANDDGVQLLGKLLAQSPTAAAALMLSQQQQLQQLQAQQQQLLQQMARVEQQLDQMQRRHSSAAAEEKKQVHHKQADIPATATPVAVVAVADPPQNGRVRESKVTADFAEIIQSQLQAVSKQIMDSLSPLQNQIHQVQAELHMMKGEGS